MIHILLFLWLVAYIGGPLVFAPLAAVPVMLISGLIFHTLSHQAAEQAYQQNMQKNALLVEFINGMD